MTSKFTKQVILNLQNDIVWEKWSEGARCALSAAFYPAMSLTEHQNGASEEQWETVRLMRHLFNTSRLPLPEFVNKQLGQIPDSKKDFWISVGNEARTMILKETNRRVVVKGDR